jgi:hypothetical protein
MRRIEDIGSRVESHSDQYSEDLKSYLLDQLARITQELIEITKEVQKWRR